MTKQRAACPQSLACTAGNECFLDYSELFPACRQASFCGGYSQLAITNYFSFCHSRGGGNLYERKTLILNTDPRLRGDDRKKYMQIEYEATFENIDKDEIRDRLKKAGARIVKKEFL